MANLNTAAEIRKDLGIITDDELALALGVEKSTLSTWRGQGRGPSFTKFGKGVYYFVADVMLYLASKRVEHLLDPVQSLELRGPVQDTAQDTAQDTVQDIAQSMAASLCGVTPQGR